MASGLYTLQASITKNLSQCLKHSFSNITPCKTRWRPITSISVNTGFVDDAYHEVKRHENVARTLDMYTLKQREKGDWRNLSLQEKQALYHMSFSQPFCYIEQPADEWKLILAGTFTSMGLMILGLYMWLSKIECAESVVGPLSMKNNSKDIEEMNMLYSQESCTSS